MIEKLFTPLFRLVPGITGTLTHACSPIRQTTFFLVCLLWVSITNADEQKDKFSEFTRALSIIEQTQLEIFTEVNLQSRDDILHRLEQRLQDTDDEESRLNTMREVLSEVLEQYNDKYANYISPEALTRYRERRTGSYHGIGLKFRASDSDHPTVIGTLTGGPLGNSEIKPGDRIIRAGSDKLYGLSSKQVTEILKGPEGTTIELELKRDDNRYTINARRSPVTLEYARSEIVAGDIGYLKISRFGGSTHEKVRQLVADLLHQNVTGIVLDLRDNPGGSTRAARSIVSIFSKGEHVYSERYKSGKERLLPRHGEHLTDLPLAIIVNGNSMSSSEIVAGALQINERGTIIGEATFGKGLVQKVFDLSPPLGGAIRTTIAEFATIDGRSIHATGIVPDTAIQTDADFMFKRTGSLNISEDARAYQRHLLERKVTKEFPDTATELIAAKDLQLQTAVESIRESGRSRHNKAD